MSTGNNNDRLSVAELEDWLWEAASSIRGAVEAPKFKDYILPLIFIKRLSDVFDDEIDRLAEKFGDRATALELVEEDPSLVRFYVPNVYSWQSLRKLTGNVGQSLTDVVRAVAKQNPSLQGVIDVVDFNATYQGERILTDAELSRLIEILSRHRLGLDDVEPDLLGRAYEFLLRKFAEGQGQSAGEFFTPREVGWLIARILEPGEGMEMYDPACGSSGLLIKARLTVAPPGAEVDRPLRLYGQERTHTTFAIAKMNMVLHDMDGEVVIGDTLRNPKFSVDGKLHQFDLVAANPMWNQPGYEASFYENDTFGRFRYGLPPAKSADWGWLQHILTSLKPTGRAAVVLDAAAVTRGSGDDGKNKEKKIRQAFVDNDLVEAVILLPDNLFYNTTAQGIIVFVNRAKPNERKQTILLIDASDQVTREKPKNLLSQSGADRIAEVMAGWKSEDWFSSVIAVEDCKAKDYNLNPARYVARDVERVELDLASAHESLKQLRDRAAALDVKASELMALLEDAGNGATSPEGWKVVRFGDVASFNLGRTPPRKRPELFSTTEGHPWVTISDMSGHAVVTETKERISDEAFRAVFRSKAVKQGTLLMTIKLTVGRTAFMGVEGVHNEAIVSILPNEEQVLPKFLYYLLPLVNYREHQDRAVKGQTINLGKLKKLELALPPVAEQQQIVETLDVLAELVQVEDEVSSKRAGVRDELIQRVLRGRLRVAREK